MPMPPLKPYRFVCPKCHWKGPIQISDVLLGPIENCPKCDTSLISKATTVLDDIETMAQKFVNIFKGL